MKTFSRSANKPAILGGKPVFAKTLSNAWPPVDKATERALVEIYRSKNFSWDGPWEKRFNRDFSRAHTAKHTVFMANGTVTLEGALHVFGIGAGDEVIVPALTWVATAASVIYNGAKPVFVDIEPDTLCIDPNKIEEAITPRTKAIIPVHLYGSMADMDRIMAIARKHGLKVIEDCAHAHGGMWNGKGLGSIGDIGSFSFQQSKTISSGEGGAVTTNDAHLYELLFNFKHIGYELGANQGKASKRPPAGLRCHNYRGTEFPAAILIGQVNKLASMTKLRNRNADFLTRELEKIPGLKVQARGRRHTPGRQNYYAFMTVLDLSQWENVDMQKIAIALNKENMLASRSYNSVYRHLLWNEPPKNYRIHGGYRDAQGPGCKVSEEVGWKRVIGMPHYCLDLPRTDLQRIIDAFVKVHQYAGELKKLKLPKK